MRQVSREKVWIVKMARCLFVMIVWESTSSRLTWLSVLHEPALHHVSAHAFSFAPPGLVAGFWLRPTACAVGWTLSLLRSWAVGPYFLNFPHSKLLFRGERLVRSQCC
jgi:hypothetical protein